MIRCKYIVNPNDGELMLPVAVLRKENETLRDQIENLKNEVSRLCEESKRKDEIINNLIEKTSTINNNNTFDNSQTINITTGQTRKILSQHSTGPPLDKITDMSLIFDEDNELFLEDIAYDYRKKILHETIGDSIVEVYKMPDPKQQAVWNTDCSRLNYLIKQVIGKKTDWVIDKMGIRMAEKMITPVLDYLKVKMDQYMPHRRNPRTLDTKGVLLAITKEINDGSLSRRINKYIANHLYLTDNMTKMITYKDEHIEQIE